MSPMIDMILLRGTTLILHVDPIFLGFGVALVAGTVLLARAASEELRRVAAREWDARNIGVTATDEGRPSA